jgi:MoaA/NifB/PqqE/SkfB family radical SAM enzyme
MIHKNSSNNPKYGFNGRLTKKFPSQINVDITEKCNHACIHCQHQQFVKSKYYRGFEMEEGINTKLVQEVRKEGRNITQYLRYSSKGEPLLHPKAYKFLLEAVHDSGVPVTLTSNGSRVDFGEMKTLFDEGLYLIDISIDAYLPDTYKKIRVGGHLDKTNENVKKMIKYRNQSGSKTRIVVSYIEQPLNIEETSRFKTFWEKQGVDYVVIRRLHSNAGTLEKIADELRLHSTLDNRKPCVYPWERICVNPDGTLHYCPASWTKDGYIADFHTTSIKETWKSEKYQDLRNAHISTVFREFPMCELCPDWVNIRWPHEGRSYANMIEDFSEKKEDNHGSE